MDAVYMVRGGPNEELRYSLRSIARNMPHGHVWVFGGWPAWVDTATVRCVPVEQTPSKSRNGHILLRAIAEHPGVSERFTLMNDDFFVMRPVGRVDDFDIGRVTEVIERYAHNPRASYVVGMRQTLELLRSLGIDEPRSFEAHVPMTFDKRELARILDLGADVWRFHARTAYGNLLGRESTTITDVKVYDDGPLPQGPYLSTSDGSFAWAKPVLRYLFPDVCRYEAAGPPTEVRNTVPQIQLVKMYKRQAKTYVPAEDVPVMVARGWAVVGSRPAPDPAPTPVAGPEQLYGYDGEHEQYECLVCHKPYKTEAGIKAHVLAKHG